MKINNNSFTRILGWLIILIICKQLLWSGFVPIWQFPDEQAHFGEVQNYAEGNPINPARTNNTSIEIDLSEQLLGTKRDGFGNNNFTYHPEFNIAYSNNTEGVVENEIKNFPLAYRHEFVTNEATAYPPLYYTTAAIFYKIVYLQDLIMRMFVVRLFNILLFVCLAFLVFGIAQLLFPQNLLFQITLTLLVMFQPMLSFLSGGVNSENLFIVLFTASIFISMRLLKYGWKLSEMLLVLLLSLAAFQTKEMGRLLPLVFVFPLIELLLKHKKEWKKMTALCALFLLLIFGLYHATIFKFIRGEQVFPEIPGWPVMLTALRQNSFIGHLKWTLSHTYREVLPWYWGVFRWLSLTYPRYIHRIINWSLVLGILGLIIAIYKSGRHKGVVEGKLLWFLLYVSAMYFMAITTFDYLFTASHGFSIGVQGRYFFPTITAHMALLYVGWLSLVNREHLQNIVSKIVGFLMVALHTYAWWFVTISYFSREDIKLFFLQASQYKPWFFKTPFLELLVFLYALTLIVFIRKYIFLEKKTNHREN